jgi:hypothetical protein
MVFALRPLALYGYEDGIRESDACVNSEQTDRRSMGFGVDDLEISSGVEKAVRTFPVVEDHGRIDDAQSSTTSRTRRSPRSTRRPWRTIGRK